MKAPFPWFGGKRRVADVVWAAFGDVHNYVEPFAGSLAVLLERPDKHQGITTGAETVNDADAYLANFWRAVKGDPEEVAKWADWPVNECVPDQTAIATPSGPVTAGGIKPGDTIYGERNGVVVATRVTAVRRSTASEFVIIGPLRVTGNHPVWTAVGYKQADLLDNGDTIGVLSARGHRKPTLVRLPLARPAHDGASLRRDHVPPPSLRGAPLARENWRQDAQGLLDSVALEHRRITRLDGYGDRHGALLGRGRALLDSKTAEQRCATYQPDGRRGRDTGAHTERTREGGALREDARTTVAGLATRADDWLAPLRASEGGNPGCVHWPTPLRGGTGEDSACGSGEGHDSCGTCIGGGARGQTDVTGTPDEDCGDDDEQETDRLRRDGTCVAVDHGSCCSTGGFGSVRLPGGEDRGHLQRESLPSPVTVVNFQTDTGNYFAAGILVHNCDLFARHLWLVNSGKARLSCMDADPDFYDAKVAGWWVWGVCAWIGSGWCSGTGPWIVGEDGRPHLGAGRGVNRKLPHLGDTGRGVNRQLPHLGDAGHGAVHSAGDMTAGGSGAPRAEWDRSHWRRGEEPLVYGYMRALQARLRRVRVCCGDWARVVTEGALAYGARVGVFLDPPYDEECRTRGLYATEGGSLSVDVREWAVDAAARDPRLRIALCGYEGEHEMPPDWTVHAWKSSGAYLGGGGGGVNRENRKRERIWFSPSCCIISARQVGLFAEVKP